MYNNRTAIASKKAAFIEKPDLISFEYRPKSLTYEIFEKYVAFRVHGLGFWRNEAPLASRRSRRCVSSP